MRTLLIAAAALLLTGCGGGGETYPVPADQASGALASVGTPPGLSPLPGVLSQVQVSFQPQPDQRAVQWLFSHDGEDIGRFVATAKPGGANATRVEVEYMDGAAPDGNWHNKQVREQLRSQIRELVTEAVDSALEHRPFNMALHDRIETSVTTATIGSTMMDVGNRMMSDDSDEAEESARRLQQKLFPGADRLHHPPHD